MIDVGQTIGNYRLTAKLGEGGMGVVYLAEHPVIGKKVALKAIHPELARNDDVVSRFVTEAKAVNQIGHDHIVDVSDFGRTSDGESYFIMEYLQGEPLADRLKRLGRLPISRALYIASQMADALGASHARGIIHRDLKPENIFLITRGRDSDFVKVLDFGLAKLTMVDEAVTHKTRTGSLMGTPYYMSPEQCEGKIEIDHRADIYSLGIMLFEMLTGKVPFGGDGYGEIIVKHITMRPPSIRTVEPSVPESIERILFRALAKDREDRFPSMEALREALENPDNYASWVPTVGVPEVDHEAVRAAAPMVRAELPAGPREELSQRGAVARDQVGSGRGTPSTFGHSRGEIADEGPPPHRPTNWILVVAAAAAWSAVGVLALFGGRTVQRAQVVAPVEVLNPPAAVRLTFASDPPGAQVVRADTGQTVGVTPTAADVPFSDRRVEFVFKKDGYESRTVPVIPNLATPVVAALQPIPPAPGATESAAAHRPQATAGTRAPRRSAPDKGPRPDDDAVLEPSFK